MGYYVRLFSKERARIGLADLKKAAACRELVFHVEMGTPEAWDQLFVTTPDGRNFCLIDRDERDISGVFDEEIEEFRDLLDGALPSAGAGWVREYLAGASVIYAAQYLSAAFDVADTNPSPADILLEIRGVLGGILQADGESFSNEQGYAVVLHFSEAAEGDWHVALLNNDGTWRTGRIDLGNPDHRSEFEQGRLPT